MRKKALSILLCVSMVLSVMPCFSASAWAAEKEGPTLAYVPLDNRTVNTDRVVYEAESAGFTVRMPDDDLYSTRLDGQPRNSNGTPYGDRDGLLQWIAAQDANTDYFVISLDQLLSGGLVNSRTMSSRDLKKEKRIMDAIVELSKNNHVYIIDTVARLATCTVGYQGATLETYNYLRDYSLKPRPVLKGDGLKLVNIVRDYPRDESYKLVNVGSSYTKVVGSMLRTRERKLNIIDYLLSQDQAGGIHYFIGIDDSNAQNTIQTNEINYIKNRLDGRGRIYSGTDELGMMAVLGLMIDYYGYDVNAAAVYFGETEGTGSGSAYDLETVKENVTEHLESLGVNLVEKADADLEIVVLTAPSKTTMNAKYISRMIDYINGNIARGVPTIVINSAPGAYSGNLEYRMLRECEMSMLLAYSSWGTVGNSIGLALGNGISRYLYLHSRSGSSDTADIAFLKGLIFSYEKDISYIRGGGKELFNTYLTEKGWSTSNFYQSEEQVKTVYTDLEKLLKTADYNVTVGDVTSSLTNCRYLKGLDGECGIIGKIGLSNYTAPFFRTYEIRFDIDVTLSDTTINGFGNAMTVSMPYVPAEGQLTYALNLYYMDQDGILHKVPCVYDKTTGTINFTTNDLPGFFTDALNMDAQTAYSLFSDVLKTAWYFDDVMYVHEKGIMSGTAANTFEPKAPMTRAMLAAALYSMAGSPEADENLTLPEDVTAGWYSGAAGWAVSAGIAAVDKSGNFRPGDVVTREELADMLWRYAKYEGKDTAVGQYPGISGYADQFAVSQEKQDGFDWACRSGIMNGTDGGTMLKPQKSATRAEAATVLKRFLESGY
jgi:hypothetical protein